MKGLQDASAIEEAMLLAHTHLDSIRIQSEHLNSVLESEPRRKWNLPPNAKQTNSNSNSSNSASASTVVRGGATAADDPELHRFRRR
jgi:hypothetical protein